MYRAFNVICMYICMRMYICKCMCIYCTYIYICVLYISLFGGQTFDFGSVFLDYTYSVVFKCIRVIIYTHTCIYNVIQGILITHTILYIYSIYIYIEYDMYCIVKLCHRFPSNMLYQEGPTAHHRGRQLSSPQW